MKLSRKWLSEFTKIEASDQEYADRLTVTGSKVELTEDLGAEIKNVVLGQLVDLKRHENSDHLWVCSVDVGQQEPVVIVTGAQNLKNGDWCPVALHKSTLPGGVVIKKGKLRGVLSNGMLCSLEELKLDTYDYPDAVEDGILVFTPQEIEGYSPGDDIRPVIGRDDHVVEFEITNNRSDCFSIIGLARESAASFDTELNLHKPQVKGSGGNVLDHLDVEIWEDKLCPRYTARVVRNIKIEPSPVWLRQRLRASGVRPINNIVDITNYIMLEYGQPMHAFDYACLEGNKIIVRRAVEGEQMNTLDGTSRTLKNSMLVIADENKAVGVAGVMGGENSEITESTKMVVFESANFDGTSIRKTANSLGMRTDASSRFEKGLDPLGTLPAVERACELVELLGAGEVVDGVVDVIASDRAPVQLALEEKKINALLGTDISREEMVRILEKIGFEVDERDIVTVPSWRLDIEHYADLAEEVARFYGYDVIEPTLVRGETAIGGYTPRQKLERRTGELLRSLGYYEIMTYSFIGQSAYDKVRLPADSPLRVNLTILNPLGEDTSQMRTLALPSMMEIVSRNFNYRNESVRLYELARVYAPNPASETLCDEQLHLTLGAYGDKMDFFGLKGVVEVLLEGLNIEGVTYQASCDDGAYHPGRCAQLFSGEQSLGRIGQIHPLTAANYGIDCDVYAAELDFEAILALVGAERTYVPLPKYPAVSRDIAVVCDDGVTVYALQSVICEAGGKLLKECRLFDIYTGAPIPSGKKSVAFSLGYRADDRTLTDEDADKATKKILDALKDRLSAVIR